MAEGNGWNEYKNLILKTLDATDKKIDAWKKDTDEKIETMQKDIDAKVRCVQKDHNTCKEHTTVEIEKLKVKNQIWASMISLAVSIVMSILVGITVHHITEKNISASEVENIITETLNK